MTTSTRLRGAAIVTTTLATGALALGTASTATAATRTATASTITAATASTPLPGSPVVNASSPAGQIRGLQQLLTARGFATTVDGAYGPSTTSRVKAFQSSRGLSQDGVAGPATLGALVTTLREGSTGGHVKALQETLRAAGHSVSVDGSFGPATKSAVLSFQRAHGLSQDGVVGPATWSRLFTRPTSTPPPAGDCSTVTAGVPYSATVVAASNFRVHTCFASRTSAMVAHAKRDGITLTGSSSWRSPDAQIALRKQNCGTSYYAIYQMPASQCSPPTAIPGTSRHERGLALDIQNTGGNSATFQWLKRNAATYHYYNLPSESWHWSWDGH